MHGVLAPLYWHVRRLGYAAPDAQDLTQAFFARLTEKRALAAADARRGRFRTFLLTALHRFVINEWKAQGAIKRGGNRAQFPLNFEGAESGFRAEPSNDMTPDRLFHRQWAIAVLESALSRLAGERTATEKPDLFAALLPCLQQANDAPSHRALGDRFGLSSDAVKMTLSRLRKRLGELIRDEVRKTVRCDDEIDDKVRDLFAALQ